MTAKTGSLELVLLKAPWSPPSLLLCSQLEELMGGLKAPPCVVKVVDIDGDPGTADSLGVWKVPTVVLLENGIEVKRWIKAVSAQELLEAVELRKNVSTQAVPKRRRRALS